MESMYVTVVGYNHYYDEKPFGIGRLIRCKKEPDNKYDSEAIRCVQPGLGTLGYIANSVNTRAGGTLSAGRIYDKVPDRFYVRVMFTTNTKIICKVEDGDLKKLDEEYSRMSKDDWEEEEADFKKN